MESLATEVLVELAKNRRAPRPALALTMAGGSSSLSRRATNLLFQQFSSTATCRRRVVLVPALLLTAMAIVLSAIQLDTARADGPAEGPAAEQNPPGDAPESPTNTGAAESGVVSGVLVKADDGTPVAGARVTLRTGRALYAQSDADGRFRFENIPDGHYGIWARKDNLVTAKHSFQAISAGEAGDVQFAPLRLTMSAGREAIFQVTSEVTGEPLSGAIVRFGFPDRRQEETAGDGWALVQGLLPETYEVTIEAEGHAARRMQIDLADAASVRQFKRFTTALARGGVIRGVVLDENRAPLPSADVVFRESSPSYGFHGDSPRSPDNSCDLVSDAPLEVKACPVHDPGYRCSTGTNSRFVGPL